MWLLKSILISLRPLPSRPCSLEFSVPRVQPLLTPVLGKFTFKNQNEVEPVLVPSWTFIYMLRCSPSSNQQVQHPTFLKRVHRECKLDSDPPNPLFSDTRVGGTSGLPFSPGSPPWSALVPCSMDRQTAGSTLRQVLSEAQPPLRAEALVGCFSMVSPFHNFPLAGDRMITSSSPHWGGRSEWGTAERNNPFCANAGDC